MVLVAAAVDEGEISEEATGSCAVTIGNRKCSNKLKRKINFILMTCGEYINNERRLVQAPAVDVM